MTKTLEIDGASLLPTDCSHMSKVLLDLLEPKVIRRNRSLLHTMDFALIP